MILILPFVDMIIDSIHLDTDAKRGVQNRLPDIKLYSVIILSRCQKYWHPILIASPKMGHPFTWFCERLFQSTVPTGTPVTHGELPSHGTMVCRKIPPPWIFHTGSSRCVILSQPFTFGESIVRRGQHFPLFRNLFEPKSYDTIIECPLWEYVYSLKNGSFWICFLYFEDN